MLVLVADDDRAVREALERALQLNGFDVALAADGNEALSATSERTPDALVLDVMMPGYDGLDVTRRLRREGNRIPILLLTARDAVGDRVEGLDAGADDYLPKPFALEELLARLRALLRRADQAPAELLRFADLTFDVGSMEARQQLLEGERLRQVVVGAGVEALDPLADRVARRQQEDRDAVALAAQPARHVEPVVAGHHHVENQSVRCAVGRRGQRLVPVGGERDVEAVQLQRPLERLPDGSVIVCHQNEHRGPSLPCRVRHR